jgi:threonylcarbamoyladenosine tRNA methylthiotransferase MtaB
VIDEVKSRVAEGYREVVLTGTKIGAYRWNGEGECHGSAEGIGLKHLLSRILAETDVERLRLSSLQPQDLTPSLMEMWSDRRLCHHLHIPLQSGSDGVLRRMGREYSTSDYERAVSLAREAIPGVAITTDVIVGFPGETADEFEESYQFCCKIGFARIHVFPYSLRPGTAASRMSHRVKDVVRKERCQQMAGLARESGRRFRQQFLGEVMGVLWEKEEGGMWSGLTDNYIRVFVESAGTLSNHLLQARLVTEMDEGVRGDLVSLTTTSPHPAGSLTVNNGQHSIGLLDET